MARTNRTYYPPTSVQHPLHQYPLPHTNCCHGHPSRGKGNSNSRRLFSRSCYLDVVVFVFSEILSVLYDPVFISVRESIVPQEKLDNLGVDNKYRSMYDHTLDDARLSKYSTGSGDTYTLYPAPKIRIMSTFFLKKVPLLRCFGGDGPPRRH